MSQSLLCNWLMRNGFNYDLSIWRETVTVQMPLMDRAERHTRLLVVSGFNRVDGKVRVRYMWRDVLLSVRDLLSLLETGVMP